MDNLSTWEEIRILAYIFMVMGFVFFVLGIHFEAASFGLNEGSLNILALLSSVIKDTGEACGMLAGIMTLVTENMK